MDGDHTAADCGRFSLCYTWGGIAKFSAAAADCGRFSLCYTAAALGPSAVLLRIALSANMPETPATFGITVGRWR